MTTRDLTDIVGLSSLFYAFFREIFMADEKNVSVSRAKVSPVRKAVSAVLLLIVSIVGFIELRASLGHRMSGQALAARANDGEFTDLSLAEATGLLKMATEATVEKRTLDTVYRYEWYSLLRPLIGQQNPQITIVASNDEKPMALAFTTADEPAPVEVTDSQNSVSSPSPMPGGSDMMGPGGAMGSAPVESAGSRQRPEMEESDGSASPPASDSPAPAATPEATPPAETPSSEAPPADASASSGS